MLFGFCIDYDEDSKMLIRSRHSRENVTMEITPILNFISIIQGRPQEVTKSTKDAHKANAIKYIPVIYKVPMKALPSQYNVLLSPDLVITCRF
jgi:hypothetical protein